MLSCFRFNRVSPIHYQLSNYFDTLDSLQLTKFELCRVYNFLQTVFCDPSLKNRNTFETQMALKLTTAQEKFDDEIRTLYRESVSTKRADGIVREISCHIFSNKKLSLFSVINMEKLKNLTELLKEKIYCTSENSVKENTTISNSPSSSHSHSSSRSIGPLFVQSRRTSVFFCSSCFESED